ncbi:restriction endonuclease [Escherichia coli O15:H16]
MDACIHIYSDEDDVRERARAHDNARDIYAHDCGQLPFGTLDPRAFELIVRDLFDEKKVEATWDWYDTAFRINDGSDNGIDVQLMKDRVIAGIVQCKRYTSKEFTMPEVRGEWIKICRRSLVISDLLPPDGLPFRYILVVSDNVNGETQQYFQRNSTALADLIGRKTDYLKALVAVRDKYALLRKSPLLKEKTGQALYDMVYPQFERLNIELYTRESLSPLVRASDNLMSIYFRREVYFSQQSVLDFFREVYPEGAIAADVRAMHAENVYTHYGNENLLSAGRLNAFIFPAGERLSVRMLGEFLKDKMPEVAGNYPVMLVCPANAFDPADQCSIDALISECQGTVILQAGCGIVPGTMLNTWKNDGWLSADSEGLYPGRAQYQAGWCWVKSGVGDIHRFILLETCDCDAALSYAGRALRLAFNDVNLWPVLNTDYYTPAGSSGTVLDDRLSLSIADDGHRRPNVLLVSSSCALTQEHFNAQIRRFESLRQKRFLGVIFCHQSQVEITDGIRYASGIYPASAGDDLLHADNGPIPALLIRDKSVTSAMFCLRFNSAGDEFTATSSYMWQWHNGCFYEVADGIQLELQRVLLDPFTDPPQFLVQEGVNAFRHALVTCAPPYAGYFVHYALSGPRSYVYPQVNTFLQQRRGIRKVIRALSYLSMHPSLSWNGNHAVTGHLLWNGVGTPESVMGWLPDEMSDTQVDAILTQWIQDGGEHCDLSVFADVEEDLPSHGRSIRQDLTRANIAEPAAEADSFAAPRSTRRAWLFPLNPLLSRTRNDDLAELECYLSNLWTVKNG